MKHVFDTYPEYLRKQKIKSAKAIYPVARISERIEYKVK
jgi:hypothetical protein